MSRDTKELLKLAKLHNAEAINELGDLYFKGIEFAHDFKKAFDYYFRAAELGYAPAQYNLGLMYAEGKNCPVDGKKAIRYFLLAAEQNLLQAQYEVACIFREGKLIKQDLDKAFFWYQKAAAANLPKAQYYLACMYLHGEGTLKDEKLAEELFLKSSETVIESKRMLGQIYRDRNDIYQSVEWYEKAANAGDSESFFMLGLFYELGPEEWRDLKKAAELYVSASQGQHREAHLRLEKLAKTELFARELLEKLMAEK